MTSLWTFLRENKWWVIVPMAIVLALFIALVLMTDTGTVAPFVYD